MKISSINSINTINKQVYKSRNTSFSGKNRFVDTVEISKRKHNSSGFLSSIHSIFSKDINNDSIKQSIFYNKHGYIDKGVKIADGFIDVGMSGRVNSDGSGFSNREIILVDRKQDSYLSTLIEHVKKSTENMTPKEKANSIYSLIHYDLIKGPKKKDIPVIPNKKVLLGDCVQTFYPTGRHISLLYKVLADEVGVKNKLTKGTVMGLKHAWNVVYLPNKKPFIFDVTNGLTEDYKTTRVYKEVK